MVRIILKIHWVKNISNTFRRASTDEITDMVEDKVTDEVAEPMKDEISETDTKNEAKRGPQTRMKSSFWMNVQ